jgi:hypothetical protein
MISSMVNAFQEANRKQVDDSKRTAKNFLFDDEVFDEFQTAVDLDDSNEYNVFDIDELLIGSGK